MTLSEEEGLELVYQSRMFDDPKPHYVTASGWRVVNFIRELSPPAIRNMMYSLIRYKDQRKSDVMYLYLPTMRRVLRGEAGQRSTPISSSTQAPDDFVGGFSGRIPEFTYKYIGDMKVIAVNHAMVDNSAMNAMKGKSFDYIPIETDNWEVMDVYVFDIIPKDPRYPQSRKRIWIIKENYFPVYCIGWDRSGNFWKIWQTTCSPHINHSAPGKTIPYMVAALGIDVQLGYGANCFFDFPLNGNGLRENDVNTASMRRYAR